MSGLSQGGHIARCDDSAWRFLGLSFAGWNALISLALFAGALKAASAAVAGARQRPLNAAIYPQLATTWLERPSLAGVQLVRDMESAVEVKNSGFRHIASFALPQSNG